jgi:hypothetical protein
MAIITVQSSRQCNLHGLLLFFINNQLPLVVRPIAEVGRAELYCHTHRALAGLKAFLGSPAILPLRGRHTKWKPTSVLP